LIIGLTFAITEGEMHRGIDSAREETSGERRSPITAPAASVPSARFSQPNSTGKSERWEGAPFSVLVVDDNRDAAESMGMVVSMLGASDVRVAFSGEEALQILSDYRPTAVLLDIGMPGMSGHDVARWIREQPRLADVKLIALSGWGQEEDREKSINAGFDHHMIKPADISQLRRLLFS
jgi:CheY-like chemotaxis protein